MRAAKRAIKRVRRTQPFNSIATTCVRSALRATGLRGESFVKHLHRIGDVDARLPNGRVLRLWSQGDDWVSNQVFWKGWDGYEIETARIFFELARRSKVVIDVGAYVGFFTLLAAHANPDSRVFAFEPLPAIFDRLTANVRRNQLDNVTCTACAVGDVEGEAEFFHVGQGLPTSSSLSYEFMAETEGLTKRLVPVITLDAFAREHGIERVDLMKIDTESTEPAVLRGMPELLKRSRPIVVCEILSGRGSEQDVQGIFAEMKYAFYMLTPDGPIRAESVLGHAEWLNYLFVPEERISEIEKVMAIVRGG